MHSAGFQGDALRTDTARVADACVHASQRGSEPSYVLEQGIDLLPVLADVEDAYTRALLPL
jgi:hypothetical protein